jgi:hypothetical protein
MSFAVADGTLSVIFKKKKKEMGQITRNFFLQIRWA